jgi:hypothetical protein
MTTFYCLRFETPPTWRAKSPYLYPPGRGWPLHDTDCIEDTTLNSYVLAFIFVAAGPFLPSRCLASVLWGGGARAHRQQADLISLLIIFRNKGSRLEMSVLQFTTSFYHCSLERATLTETQCSNADRTSQKWKPFRTFCYLFTNRNISQITSKS